MYLRSIEFTLLNMSPIKLHSSSNLDIFSAQSESELDLPVLQGISAGLPQNDPNSSFNFNSLYEIIIHVF